MDPHSFEPGLIDVLPHPVFVVDNDGAILAANAAAQRFAGSGGARGSLTDLLDQPATCNLATLHLEPRDPFTIECLLRRDDGARRWHRLQFAPTGGTTWVCSALDVDDGTREIEAMRRTDERYRVIFDSMDQGFCVIEVLFNEADIASDFVIHDTNPAFARITGLNGAVQSIRSLLPDLEDHWFERYGAVALTGKPDRFVGQVAALEHRWFEVSAFRLGDAESRTVAILFSDYTAQRRASEDTARLAAIVESSRDAIHGRTLDGFVTSWNQGAEEVYGYSESEMLGRHVSILFPPKRDVELTEISDQLQRGERIPPFETVRQRKDGTLVDVELTLSPISDANGQIVGVAAISRNVSERQAAERRQQALLEAISHDLKNPLTTVSAHAQLLRRRLDKGVVPDVEMLTRTVEAIQIATQRLNTQLGELQDVVRLRAGEPLELRTAPTDLVSLATTAVADAQLTTADHQILVQTAVTKLAGNWDAIRLRRVIDNLLDNAIKYSPAGGEIHIELGEQQIDDRDWAIVTVRDQGVGIPDQDLPHVFERYRRGSNVGDRTVGAGIGLAGARQIVQQHGGSIAIESTENRGSTFTIRLPLVQAP